MANYWQIRLTEALSRTQFRKEANAADNKGASKAVDSLINYEAVKVRANFLASRYSGRLICRVVSALQQRKVRS